MSFIPAGVYYGLMAAGTAASAYGTIQQGRAQRREADYNAKVEENNAISAGYAAIQEQEAAAREANQIRDTRLRALSTQRSAAAHAGLAISGSVIDVMGDSALEAEKEIQMSLYRGRVSSYNQGQQASNLRTRAKLTRMAGRNASRSATLQGVGTLIGGVGSAGAGYASFKKS